MPTVPRASSSALSPTLPVPTGWSPAFLPGADLLLMSLPGPDRTTPVFTVRRWNTNADLPDGSEVHDPRTDSAPETPRFGTRSGPDPARGLPVGMDRWSGGDWFGLRFLRLVPSLAGQPMAETRWLLWSAVAGLPEGFDPLKDTPVLDATAVCAVGDLPPLEMLMDSMAGAIPADWAPALAAGHPSPQTVVRVDRNVRGAGGTAAQTTARPDGGHESPRELYSAAGAWAGASMVELAPTALEFLCMHRPEAAWGELQDESARPVLEAGLADAATRRLTDRSFALATILQHPDQVSTVTIHSQHGRHRTLELFRAGSLVAAVAHALPVRGMPDGALIGLFPAERAPELVLRAAALGPSDSRRLGQDTVSRDLLVRRALNPKTELPEHLAGDARWQDLWESAWLLWTLETEDRAPNGTKDGVPAPLLMALNAGRHGNQVLTRPAGEAVGAHGDTNDEVNQGESVRLVPAQTSSLLVTLLNRLTPQPSRHR
ncbi:hypothetical protein [Citricoccus muralis]|uniref:Uncharacterized protein n=1 Tax=Citricoccus muralis TaxID=169134 RepID=A0A3D9LE38_9MICC|nr:hypothetical protein [Citricoccus muralis]REE03707.1 hypothetical protein C8E99_1523 [Citricoccus muralis]